MLRPPVESSHYTFHDFDKYCRKHEIRRSLGKTGICYDDAVSESFFATYKKELIHTQPLAEPENPHQRNFQLGRGELQPHQTPLHARILDT